LRENEGCTKTEDNSIFRQNGPLKQVKQPK